MPSNKAFCSLAPILMCMGPDPRKVSGDGHDGEREKRLELNRAFLGRSLREERFDHRLAGSTWISEPLRVRAPRLGRRTVVTVPLLPPPQKN